MNSEFNIELPGWDDDVPFKARLKRPSLLSMAANGTIPNELLGAAQRLFNEGFSEHLSIADLGKLFISIAKEALVSPTFFELDQMGITLTDAQLSAIYSFAHSGVRALLPFRTGRNADEPSGDVQAL